MKGYFCTVFALLGSLLLTVSCGREGRQADVLSRLDSLVEADADSALRLMGRMQDNGWTRRDAMRLELLRAKAMNRADSLFTTDSLMRRVAQFILTPSFLFLSVFVYLLSVFVCHALSPFLQRFSGFYINRNLKKSCIFFWCIMKNSRPLHRSPLQNMFFLISK